MVSFTSIGVLLFAIPFTVIALHSFREYLRDKKNPKKKHLFYAFLCISTGCVINLACALMVSQNMSPSELMIVNVLSKLFDVFNIIGAFFGFCFLTDFMQNLKKYIPFVFIHMAITAIIILSTKAGIIFIDGSEFAIDRAGIRSIAIIFFWFLYWSITAYQFWKCSRLMTNKVAMRRCQMMSTGAVFAVLAYVAVILAKVYQSTILVFFGEFSAMLAGVVLYIGFVAPERLRRRWEKQTNKLMTSPKK